MKHARVAPERSSPFFITGALVVSVGSTFGNSGAIATPAGKRSFIDSFAARCQTAANDQFADIVLTTSSVGALLPSLQQSGTTGYWHVATILRGVFNDEDAARSANTSLGVSVIRTNPTSSATCSFTITGHVLP